MANYTLCYIKDEKISLINLKDYNISNIKSLDEFTTTFNNMEELLNELYDKNLIPEKNINLYVYNLNKQKIIYNGDIILYKNNKINLNINYVKENLAELKNKPLDLFILLKIYLKKYKNKSGMINKIKNLCQYASTKKEKYYNSLSSDEKSRLEEYFTDFIRTEFYFKRQNKIVEDYSTIRDFVVNMMYVDDLFDLDRKHSYLKYNYKKDNLNDELDYNKYENEEFFEESDKSINEEILANKIVDSYELIDGNDYYKSLSKKVLKLSLDETIK